MEKKWLALSVAAMVAAQPAAGVFAAGDDVHSVLTKVPYTSVDEIKTAFDAEVGKAAGDAVPNSGGGGGGVNGSVTITPPGGQRAEQETLADAKAAAEDALAALEATNETTAQQILDAVTAAITLDGVTAAWTETEDAENPVITPATTEAAGSITGEITLTLGADAEAQTDTVTVNLEIPQLTDEGGEEESPLADAKAAVETMLETYVVTLDTSLETDEEKREDVKADLLAAAQEAVANETVTVKADSVTVTLPKPGIKGTVGGSIQLSTGEGETAVSETVEVSLEIAALPVETLEELVAAVEDMLKTYTVDNTLATEEAVKDAVLTAVKTQVDALMDGVTTAWDKDGEEDDVDVLLPTTQAPGHINGFIALTREVEATDPGEGGEQTSADAAALAETTTEKAIVEVELTIAQIVEENESLAEAVQIVENTLEDMTLTNSSQEDKILDYLAEEIDNSDIELEWSDTEPFDLEPATTEETGLITGTIVLSMRGVAQPAEVKVEKELALRKEGQLTSEEAQTEADEEIDSISPDNDIEQSDISRMLNTLFTGTYIEYRWGTGPEEKFTKIVPTTTRTGQISGTFYVFEKDDPTSELPVKILIRLSKKSSTSSGRPSSSGGSSGGNNSYTIPNTDNTTDTNTDTDTPTTPEKKQFADLDNYAWAKAQIDALVEKGVINGVSDTEFAPANNIKRADFLVMAMRLAGLNDTPTDNFADVPADSYYYNAVGIAKQLGITSGAGDNQFLPETNITRQDMFVLAYNLLKNQGVITADADVSVLDSFADAADVADYAKVAVATLLANGFINGDDANRINPLNNATRAESAVFLFNVSEKMN